MAQIFSLEFPQSLGVYAEYGQAQKAVDHLADHDFPVQNVLIVGTDLKQVERVTGRLTWGRVLAGGAASGAWVGLFVGLLIGLFAQEGSWFAAVATGLGIGLVWGVVFAAVRYSSSGGERDFASVKGRAAHQVRGAGGAQVPGPGAGTADPGRSRHPADLVSLNRLATQFPLDSLHQICQAGSGSTPMRPN